MRNKLIKIWLVLLLFLVLLITAEVSVYLSQQRYRTKIANTIKEKSELQTKLQAQIETINFELGEKVEETETLATEKENLTEEIQNLNGKIAGLTDQKVPFVVPSNGLVATYAGTFGGNMNGMRHLGIDIWTTTKNSGILANHKGNAVYSACDGKVVGMDPNNAGLTIDCDEIDKSYALPAYKVYTHYSHLGHAETKELYNVVGVGTRVKAGQLIGYQGDLSSYFPEMRNVHLHFSVFTGISETDKKGGALNPCLYIGGDCSKVGQEFVVKKD